MDGPEAWRWLWLATTVTFTIGEMASPGSFFLLPFAIGALVATILAFADASLALQWGAFVGLGLASLVALRPVARRMDQGGPSDGIGSRRLIGQDGVVLEAIGPGGELGLVRIDREEWRAESTDGETIAPGTVVRIADIQGTRVIVASKELMP